jgi:two-component sensor histidine kinase
VRRFVGSNPTFNALDPIKFRGIHLMLVARKSLTARRNWGIVEDWPDATGAIGAAWSCLLLALKVSGYKEREAADKLQKLILEELHHRIKNTLATVSAIASQSLRTATSIEHGQHAIEGRLMALGRAHDLLMQVSWANSSLVNTVRRATEPYDGQSAGRFSIDGPDIGITSGAVIALAMTLNELCTNTTKFGALSVPTGGVAIVWTIDDETERLRMTWTEKGGPAVTAPTRRSLGTRMMGSLGQQLNGKVELDYRPTGFVYMLDVPLNSLTVKA